MAVQKRTYKQGDVLINFGDQGDEYFILDTGCVEVQVFDEETKEEIAKKTISKGGAFGELALLYNSPRSATITALTDCAAHVLDRKTFKSIIMANAVRIRNIRYQFLDKIKVFEKMDRYKKLKLLDGLEV